MADAMRTTSIQRMDGSISDPADTHRHAARPWPDLDVLEGGRSPLRFGEFLVQEGALDRTQLFLALQMQDRLPGILIGQCAVALGYLTVGEVEWMHQRFTTLLASLEG